MKKVLFPRGQVCGRFHGFIRACGISKSLAFYVADTVALKI